MRMSGGIRYGNCASPHPARIRVTWRAARIRAGANRRVHSAPRVARAQRPVATCRGQDQRVRDEAAVVAAVDNAARWLVDRNYNHVLVEINNECDVRRYDHAILRPERVHELIERVKKAHGPRLPVGTSYGGGSVPRENVVRASDFLLVHGNGVSDPRRIAEMVRDTRRVPGYRPMPVLFNEDDHFDFDKPDNNFSAAVGEYASWGYFDPGASDYRDGYQCPPVEWGINTDRKRAFFRLVAEMTGEKV